MSRIAGTAFILVVIFAAFGAAGPASAQESRCADCHLANFATPTTPGLENHLSRWDLSPHGRNRVGCDSCHGGNPRTFERLPAHQGVLNGRNPASPVQVTNLPRTCGRCHSGPFTEFQKSRHDELLRDGDATAPSCSTCHGEVGAHLLAPRALERQCANCHGAGKTAPRPEYGPRARSMLEGVREVRALLNEARPLVRRVKDKARRAALEAEYGQADVPLKEAIHAGHAFVYDNLQERLDVARRRAEVLLEQLANPK